jgi:ABC-type cobalt transport system, permease component CbiQ and related transporters
MLKDVTLGQYFPGNSLIHLLDPRTKLVFLTIFIVALFSARQHPVIYGLMLVVLFVSVGISTISPKIILKGMKPVIFVLIFTGLLNMFYTPGRPVFTIGVFTMTYEGVRTAIFMIVRIVTLICSTFLLTYTTSPLSLTNGLETLLNPLKKIKFPVHELAMIMSIALRFIPNLIEDTDKIMSAQRARGADFDTGNFLQKAKALIPLLVPLFVSSFRRADELAVAMECRCYHGGEGRTRLKQLQMNNTDVVVLCFSVALLVVVLVLNRVVG